ncbi:hypothetical protein PG995_005654 [Apiospora arundinis]
MYPKLIFYVPVSMTLVVNLCWAQIVPPVIPLLDPFYDEPGNISEYGLGEVVRSRPINDKIKGVLGYFSVASATEFMYRSTDANDNAVADVATILAPDGNNADNTKLLSYAVAYNSPNPNCVPSYAVQLGSLANVGPSNLESLTINAAINRGWYVLLADHAGLKGEFVVGRQMGFSILDAMRMALGEASRNLTGLSVDARVAQFGYSHGSLATGFAAEMAGAYAPDLVNFVGTALGGTIANGTRIFEMDNARLPAGILFSSMLGLAHGYKNFSDLLDIELGPRKPAFEFIGNNCPEVTGMRGLYQDMFAYFRSGSAVLFNEVYKTVASGAFQMGVHGTPNRPLYLFKGVLDEISAITDTEQLVDEFYCTSGATVEYVRNLLTGHVTGFIFGTPGAYDWIEDRLNGVPLTTTSCTRRDVVLKDPNDIGVFQIFGETAIEQGKNALGLGSNGTPPFITLEEELAYRR